MIARDFSIRAVLTGMAIGGALSACNIYSGLKIGWSSNMSITGALLAYAAWQLRSRSAREARPYTILETNLSQTASSSAAAVSSAGLVAAIPALTVLTGLTLPWWQLALWVGSVCFVGIVIAVPLRRQMLVQEPLPFPFGIATAETLKQMYAKGAEAMARVRALLLAAGLAGIGKMLEHLKVLKTIAFPGAIKGTALSNLTFALDPSMLLVAVGGLMGMRAALSVIGGSLIAYAVIGPELLAHGLVLPGKPGAPWFKELVGWLLWPGVTLMVISSLTSFALSWRSVVKAFSGLGGGARPSRQPGEAADEAADVANDDVPSRWFLIAAGLAFVLSVGVQVGIFGIPAWIAAVGVILSLALAIVGARVNGETGVTPVGAMGKVTQLVVGGAMPGDVTANLMTANVTGGSASQCADLMNDLKTGQMLGSSPKSQWLSQLGGAVAGATIGSAIYLALLRDPKSQLFTPEWPAPAVITWKAVAEVFQAGLSALPQLVLPAMGIAAAVGVALAIAEVKSPKHVKKWLPSPSALGLGFVVPANQGLSMVLGGLFALLVARRFPTWHERFWVVVCAGIIAGESLVGVGLSLKQMLGG
ncbi:MAG TPA: OPT family oligopeptide transporter [Candidatus Nanopelagicales bacterium]|nr:OPT family oligopeptide transporter [Candidatus Nanopelagicales bacterium]